MTRSSRSFGMLVGAKSLLRLPRDSGDSLLGLATLSDTAAPGALTFQGIGLPGLAITPGDGLMSLAGGPGLAEQGLARGPAVIHPAIADTAITYPAGSASHLVGTYAVRAGSPAVSEAVVLGRASSSKLAPVGHPLAAFGQTVASPVAAQVLRPAGMSAGIMPDRVPAAKFDVPTGKPGGAAGPASVIPAEIVPAEIVSARTVPARTVPARTVPARTVPATIAPVGSALMLAAPQAAGSNRIALENAKQGTPESVWQLPNGVNSTTIQGFTTRISANVGQTVDFKVKTVSKHYRIDIYRTGYYGGDGARLVGSIERNLASAQAQPNPITKAQTGEVDAGNWGVSASWAVPTDAVSGVYVANLVREDGTNGVFQIPFVVRDDSLASDIVFQTADQTWQAYNGWGGANLYGGNGPGQNGAAYAVSYNRPIVTGDPSGGYEAGPQDTFMGVEYATVRWLEQNGYDVSYLSGVDASGNGSLLLNHKVYLEAGHDEYWTASQRANVEAARAAGVNLAFLSGNELYWRTQLTPSIDGSNTPGRTLVTYKDTHYDALINPSGEWTGTWADPRFVAGQPANSLTGQVFSVDSYRADTITIPYAQTQLRIWRTSGVAATAAGQTASLTKGLLGYEWDSSPDNGFRPAGLVNLSSTTVQVSQALLDYGNTVGNGTATHNLIEYRDPSSGALVFGAGTVFWSWGLSDDHELGESPFVAVDRNVQQATVNFLADMGVQPGTLQASLTLATQSTDRTSATSSISNLSATSVVEGDLISVTGTASDVGGKVAGIEVSSDGGITWHPATLATNGGNAWSYSFTSAAPGTYVVKSRATDDSLNTEAPGAGLSYTVTASPALSLFTGETPATPSIADTTSAELGVRFVSATNGQVTALRFYKSAQDVGVHTGHLWSAAGTLLASATFANETASGWQQVNLANSVRISAGASYVASYHTAGRGYAASNYYFDNPGHTRGSLTASGNGLNGLYTYNTGTALPTIATAANYFADVVFRDTSQGPQANDDTGLVATQDTALVIPVASLLVNDTDPNGHALSVTGVSNPTNGAVSFDAAAQTVRFTPTAGYSGPAGFSYTISDGFGAAATGNVGLTVNYAANAQSLFFAAETPATVTVADATSLELGVKFRASVNGVITGIRFYKGPSNTGPHKADLWSGSGTLLASANFSNETASGWQFVAFASPVAITGGTTYVASYHTNGNYSADTNYFATTHSLGALTAPDSASSGGNGVYAVSGNPVFPTLGYNASNYWVDVVFSSAGAAVVARDDSFSATQDSALTLAAASLLANDTDPYGYPLSITAVANASHGTVAYDAANDTVRFTPNAGYVGPAGFSYSVGDGHGGTAGANVVVNVSLPQPVAGPDLGLVALEDTALVIPVATLLANDTDPLGYALSVTGVDGPSTGTVSFDAAAQTISFTPGANYTGPASFSYAISNGHGGAATGQVGLTVTYPANAQSLFYKADTPATVTVDDPKSVELGVKFRASANGSVTGLCFYKGDANTGPHLADLWSSAGALLATANFSNETASGWQSVNFANAVSIVAGTTYVASYHTNGNYSATGNYFAAPHSLGQLTAPDSASSGGNGVYAYGAGRLFPTGSFNATNYWVDVVFSSASLPPVANPDSFAATENSPLTLGAAALLGNDTDPYGYALSLVSVAGASHGTVAFDTAAQTIRFTPDADYTGSAGFTYRISDGHGGSAQASVAIAVDAATAPIANTDGGLIAVQDTALVIPVAALLANDTDPGGYPLSVTGVSSFSGGTATYDAAAQTITFTPNAGFVGPAGFAYTIGDGHGGGASGSVSLTVEPPGTATLFSAGALPTILAADDASPIEVGVKFQADADGMIAGLRFYKGAANTGPHVADLWSSGGDLLASASFGAETASGWQFVSFAAPVAITAGTTYVASYHTSGHYSADPGYFASAYTSGPLTAPSSAAGGGNGVFAYGANPLFPTSAYGATNYWVDVVFTAGGAGAVLRAVADAASTNQNTPLGIAATGLLANDVAPYAGDVLTVSAVNGSAANVGVRIALASGALLTVAADGGVSYDPNGRFAALRLGQSATDSFSYTVRDSDGATSSAGVSITVAGLNDAPVAAADGYATSQNSPLNVAAASGLLANDVDVDSGDTKAVSAVNGVAANVGSQITLASGARLTVAADGGLVYDPNGRFAGLALGQSATDTFSYTLRDGQGATSSATATVTVGGLNDAPVAVPDSGATAQGRVLNVAAAAGLLANDTDPDSGDTRTVSAINGVAANVGSTTTLASGARLTVAADGGYAYDPNGRFATLALGSTATDSFTYTVRDGQGATSTATDTITIAGQAPTDVGFTLAGSFATLDSSGRLASGVTLGSFAQTGGIAGDTYTYSLASGSAAQFSLSSAGVLKTNATVAGAAAGAVYTLNVRALDGTVGASATRAFNVVVGNDSANTISLADGTPTIAFGLQGSDKLNGTGDTVPLWLVAGGNGLNEGSGKASFLTGGGKVDVLLGGSGGDSLRGAGAADTLTGGGGADKFLYGSASDSTLASPDVITDFLHGTDLIDFTTIAGIGATPGAWQGRITGTLAAHGIGWVQNGSDTNILVNTTGGAEGAGAAQMEIILRNVAGSTLSSIDVRHA